MNKVRYSVLDGIRGFALIHMIIYHAVWDLVYIFGFHWTWFYSEAAYIWQQGICWTFIFLSGFCQPLGRKKLKRGLYVFGSGLLVSLVTILTMPQNRVMFGVLTLIGSCMLLILPMESILKHQRPLAGLFTSLGLFALTKNINQGSLGFGPWSLALLPKNWYSNLVTTYLGLPMPGFYSTDYFSLFPWLFLFTAGYYLYHFFDQKKLLPYLEPSKIKAVEWIGRRSLSIYIIHQPVIYLVLAVFFHPAP